MHSGSGQTYEVSGETTEWEDILIKKNIISKEEVYLNKGLNPDDYLKKESVTLHLHENNIQSHIEEASLEELDDMEDEESDERMIQQYREKRLEELRISQVKNRFGEVCDISRDSWVREVTDSSKTCWVVVHLYQDSNIDCRLVHQILEEIAIKYKFLKILRIPSTQAVENWPDRNLPALFLYHEGVLKEQLVTLRSLRGKTTKDIERWLADKNIIDKEIYQEDEDEEDNTERSLGKRGMKMRIGANRRSALDEDDDDDN